MNSPTSATPQGLGQFKKEYEAVIQSILSVVYPDIRKTAESDLRNLVASAVCDGVARSAPSASVASDDERSAFAEGHYEPDSGHGDKPSEEWREALGWLREAEDTVYQCTGSAFLSGENSKPADRESIRKMLLSVGSMVSGAHDVLAKSPPSAPSATAPSIPAPVRVNEAPEAAQLVWDHAIEQCAREVEISAVAHYQSPRHNKFAEDIARAIRALKGGAASTRSEK